MKAGSLYKLGLLIASVLLVASCSKTPGSADGAALSDGDASAQGLGQMTHFAGQEPGESYTTQAPHNQLYLFSYDDSTLASKYLPSVNAQAEYLKTHSGARVLLAGHTDERGSREYNVALGEHRANTVADILFMAGVSRQQVRVVSYGKERPANYGHDEASHAQNRRVEFTYEATR
ncbi:peptidoglycan-associated lipoprotein precursor (19 kDa surface antigen) (PPL) [Legionella moravica]|uniref:Peptidoglycan-associated lipoprotein n=1 Tax=Legionella moravica TaxID=39962 RepID=A0A378JXE4_9GAMM|nr:peptidoglycan-associated lipoprotein Pal [Legionella moravica]KTD31757.1 peptidoglycan-associated lipoprotein precursor (19 kDa surface antigen) (PPL) [Legionella moravica]STX62162.1 Peptidoglycan-associated lipoprotein precursor [Legionella moravica]